MRQEEKKEKSREDTENVNVGYPLWDLDLRAAERSPAIGPCWFDTGGQRAESREQRPQHSTAQLYSSVSSRNITQD